MENRWDTRGLGFFLRLAYLCHLLPVKVTHAMDAQIELRQHVWKRNGVAVWVGAGTIFPRLSEFTPKHILPNYGFGYRWEFKKRVNVRLDLGFGKHQTGFIFNINEAF